jgi:hypothetical protein
MGAHEKGLRQVPEPPKNLDGQGFSDSLEGGTDIREKRILNWATKE